MSILQKLTEGVQNRNLNAEGAALLNKWEATGLLEGLGEGQQKQGMAVLLENQAKELLREASSMAAGDVEGFAAVAFPIVRRVFGGLIANDLVSVQPMSLPSGLIFFLDFTHSDSRLGATADASLYGGGVVGSQLTGGVNIDGFGDAGGVNDARPGGHYEFGHGHASPTGSALLDETATAVLASKAVGDLTEADKKLIDFDPDILAGNANDQIAIYRYDGNGNADALSTDVDLGRPQAITAAGLANGDRIIRRLTSINSDRVVTLVIHHTTGSVATGTGVDITLSVPLKDTFTTSGLAAGAIAGASQWALEEPARAVATQDINNVESNGPGGEKATGAGDMQAIAEIDIKVDSIAVTAQTKKLKAKWTPELGQDLNAYHNLDAEVELTGILSEQIALEIDRELLGELVGGAKAGTRYWSRAPGLFVDSSGNELGATSASPDFTGTVSEWYETLIETINDVSAQIHRKTLRGGANFVVCSPEVANILEFTSGFRASVTADQDRGTIGAVRAGSLSKKFDVYVDPYFIRNVLLVGRKGSSFLESGFVYAPYVPLQVTPTIFGTEDFVPRKGVMTRYAKKMVRPDMYGLVVVRGLLGEAGAS